MSKVEAVQDVVAASVSAAPARRTAMLSELARGRSNNFNLVRAMLASMVLIHHAFVLTGNRITDTSLWTRPIREFGETGVNGFFFVSGMLVARSLLIRRDVIAFALARFLRIYPGLWVMLLVTTLSLSALSTLPFVDYATSGQTLRYVVRNATAFFITFDLPGLFQDQPNNAVNGSLWSLRYELLCYAGLAAAGLLGLAHRKWPFLLGVLACAALFLWPGEPNYFVGIFRRLGLMFGLGAVAAAYADRIPLKLLVVAALTGIAFLFDTTVVAPILWSVAFGYAILWFAYVPKGPVLLWNKLPDVSYGLYIYAFPVQQALIATGLALTPFLNMGYAGVIVATLATISWYAIEKPALALKDRLTHRPDVRVPHKEPEPALLGEQQAQAVQRAPEAQSVEHPER